MVLSSFKIKDPFNYLPFFGTGASCLSCPTDMTPPDVTHGKTFSCRPNSRAGALPGAKCQLLSLNHMSLKLKVQEFGYLM